MKVGLIGWRGMVGSVLLQRMQAEGDFDLIEPVFFSTSQAGGRGPQLGRSTQPVKNARDIAELGRLDVLISCQGGDYTNEIHPKLRAAGWQPYSPRSEYYTLLRRVDDGTSLLPPTIEAYTLTADDRSGQA